MPLSLSGRLGSRTNSGFKISFIGHLLLFSMVKLYRAGCRGLCLRVQQGTSIGYLCCRRLYSFRVDVLPWLIFDAFVSLGFTGEWAEVGALGSGYVAPGEKKMI